MIRYVVPVVLLAACTPKGPELAAPTLPSDGTAHLSTPPPPPARPDDPWANRTDKIEPPAMLTPRQVELPPITELTLSNGLQVYAIRDQRLPTIDVRLAIKAGREQEPRSRLGVAEATADLLVKGTRTHDGAALAKLLDFVGGTIGVDATFEATLLSCGTLARDRGTCFNLMAELLTQSTFSETELAKVKNQMLDEVRQRTLDSAALASEHVQNLLWGQDHVRGWINSEESVTALHRDDVVAWAKTWYVPNNSLLVVAGDIDPKALKGELERAFAGWKKAPVPPSPSFKEPGLSGSRIRVVDRPGDPVTQIRIAQFGIRHDDPRFFDTLVWNHAFGGSATSRLAKAIAGKRPAVRGATAAFDRNLDRGSFVIQAAARNSDALATAKLLLAQLAKLQKEGPSDQEIAQAIAALAGGYEVRFQSASDIASALVAAELHNYGREYLQNYAVALGKVDGASARRAAAEIIDPRNYVIVFVGDAKDIEPQLKAADWRYEKMSFTDEISPPPKLAEEPADATHIAAARKLLDEAVAAKGGKARLSAIKAMHEVGTGTTTIRDRALPVVIDRTMLLPDHMRIDATLGTADQQLKIEVAVGGGSGWEIAPDPKTGGPALFELHDNDMAAAQFEAWRDPELLLLKAIDPKMKLTPLADDTIDGNPVSAIKLASPFGLDVVIFIDQKTKLVRRLTYSDQGASETDDFTDYRDVKGIKVAYQRTSTTLGRVTVLTLDKVDLAAKIDPKIFDKPVTP